MEIRACVRAHSGALSLGRPLILVFIKISFSFFCPLLALPRGGRGALCAAVFPGYLCAAWRAGCGLGRPYAALSNSMRDCTVGPGALSPLPHRPGLPRPVVHVPLRAPVPQALVLGPGVHLGPSLCAWAVFGPSYTRLCPAGRCAGLVGSVGEVPRYLQLATTRPGLPRPMAHAPLRRPPASPGLRAYS